MYATSRPAEIVKKALADVPWVVTGSARGRVHFVGTDDTPWCRRRKKAADRQFKNVIGAGTGYEAVAGLGVQFCPDCLSLASAVPVQD